MKSSLIIVLGLAVLGAGCVDRAAQQQAKQTQQIVTNPVKSVAVMPAATQTVSQSIEITGDVVTAEDSNISAKQSGRLVRVYVKDGDSVFPNELIAEQDSSQLQASYRQALAGVASAQSQLAQAMQNARLTPGKSAAATQQARAQILSAEQQLRSARANLAKVKAGGRPEEVLTAQAQLRSAKAALDKASKELSRMRELVAQGASAQADLDVAQWNYDSALATYQSSQENLKMVISPRPEDVSIAQAGVDQAIEGVRTAQEGLKAAQASQKLDVLLNDAVRTAQAQVSAAQAQADAARVAIDDTKIRSPFAGKVAGHPMQAGSIAGSGTTIARIVGSSGAYFEGQVSEDQVSVLTRGMPVAIQLDALPGEHFTGSVQAVSNQGSDVGRLFTVRITFSGPTGDIKPGMFAKGDVTIKSVPGATVVPANAIVRKNNQDVVFLADNDKAKQVAVTRGIAEGTVVQVVGIKPGDKVIVQGQNDLDNGVKIKVDMPVTATPSKGS